MRELAVIEVVTADTYALRRRVLRVGTASTDVRLDVDDDPRAFHLGIDVDGQLVACVTFAPQSPPHRTDSDATRWRFRAMAVDTTRQGAGLGRTLLVAGFDHLRARGATYVWATARDSALGFYVNLGMHVMDDGFVDETTGLPHHLVELDLV